MKRCKILLEDERTKKSRRLYLTPKERRWLGRKGSVSGSLDATFKTKGMDYPQWKNQIKASHKKKIVNGSSA